MIELNNDLAINADNKCYILGKPYTYTAKGKKLTVLQSPTYHTSMAHAIETAVNILLRKKVSEGEIDSLAQYKKELVRLQETFRTLIDEALS